MYFSASEEQVRPPFHEDVPSQQMSGENSAQPNFQLASSQSPLTFQFPSNWESMQGGATWARDSRFRGLVRRLCVCEDLLQILLPFTLATSFAQLPLSPLSKKDPFIFILCACVCSYMSLCAHVYRCPRRPERPQTPELGDPGCGS